jgi:hypothetical protein
LFSKGASEMVLAKCNRWINERGEEAKLEVENYNTITQVI